MCIRDRHTVVGGSDLLTAGGGQLGVQSICLLFTLVGLFPVSYTHLDVYKRQEVALHVQAVDIRVGVALAVAAADKELCRCAVQVAVALLQNTCLLYTSSSLT